MARPVSLATLRDSARLQADMEASSFVTDVEVEDLVQSSATRLYDIILTAWGERYFFAQTDLTTTASQAYVNLPSNFYRLLKVGWVVGSSTDPVRLEPFQDDAEWADSFWGSSGSWSNSNPPRYQLRADQLWLDPTPSSAETLRLQYVPIMPEIEDATPTPFQGVNGWDRWIVLDVAIQLKIKEESDVRALQTEREKVEGEIRNMVPRRDVGRTHRIQRRRTRRWLTRYL